MPNPESSKKRVREESQPPKVRPETSRKVAPESSSRLPSPTVTKNPRTELDAFLREWILSEKRRADKREFSRLVKRFDPAWIPIIRKRFKNRDEESTSFPESYVRAIFGALRAYRLSTGISHDMEANISQLLNLIEVSTGFDFFKSRKNTDSFDEFDRDELDPRSVERQLTINNIPYDKRRVKGSQYIELHLKGLDRIVIEFTTKGCLFRRTQKKKDTVYQGTALTLKRIISLYKTLFLHLYGKKLTKMREDIRKQQQQDGESSSEHSMPSEQSPAKKRNQHEDTEVSDEEEDSLWRSAG
jgi:hypothetical protein